MFEKLLNLKPTYIAVLTLLCCGSHSLRAESVSHGVAAALFNVIQNDAENTTNSVAVSTTISVNGLAVREGSNRGDVNVQIGEGFSDDASSGVLMTCVAENGRENNETNYPGINYCTTAADFSRSGGTAGAYFVPCYNAPQGAEFNVNIAAAYFPYSNWIGGLAQNSGTTNGGANDVLIGSPGLVLGTHFVDNGSGISTVDLRGLGIHSQTDGVLLVTAAKNEDNFATSQVNVDGTWTLYVKDNGSDASAAEQDPVAFVFIPKTNTMVISGRFRAGGEPLLFSGASPQFSVTNTDVGTWRLTIPGHSPKNGVLIISADGGLSQNQDNIVSYQPDGDGWIIQSRDLPSNGLQTPSNGLQPVASFVFVPVGSSLTQMAPSQTEQSPLSPELKVAVSNSTPGNVTVKFFGRQMHPNPAEDFTLVALPDTQFYTDEVHGGTKEMFIAQTEWIIANRVSRNIAYVAHLGDISNNGDVISGSPNTSEWLNATNAMYRLESPSRTLLESGIPYGMAVGNHDLEPIGDATGTSKFFNQYFGVTHFDGKSYYAGHYGTNNNNHFDLFSVGGMDFIVLYFEYNTNTNAAALTWGDQVMQTNQNRRAIIVTHNFGGTTTPVNFSPQGAAIYNRLKHNTNIFMMLAGHVTGAGSRADTYAGNTIRTFVSDYQGWTNGGNGFLRLMTFSPRNNQIVVQTYSPWTGEYRTESSHEFFFDYNMQVAPVEPFALIGTLSGVSPNSVSSLSWPNRQPESSYEWYVTVTDSENNTTTGPVWKFTTQSNSAPSASSQFWSVLGDAATNFVLTATDPDGDVLSFETDSEPTHGITQNFDPNTGAITYVPVRGYRGFDQFSYHATDGKAASPVVTFNVQVTAPPDDNTNGIPDFWENTYGISDPNDDIDGDGQSNLDEYFANTNPTNANSVLHISDASLSPNGNITLMWPSVGGSRYRVQFSTGDANGSFNGIFTDIVRSVDREMDEAPVGTPSTQIFVDDFTQTGNAPTNVPRFYRIKVVQ